MINPLRSEAEAFRFVIGALVYFGAIAAATVANKWAGVAVFVLLTAGVFVWWARARRDEAPIRTAPRPSGANVENPALGAVAQPPDVLVVVLEPGSAPGSVPGSAPASGSAPFCTPLPAHSVLHFDATQFASALRFAFDAHVASLSLFLRHR